MLTFTGLVMIVFGILQIILFFKLWGMTNDIRDIKNKYLNAESQHCEVSEPNHSASVNETKDEPKHYLELRFQPGDLVVLKTTGKQMRVKDVIDGKFSCYSQNGMVHDGIFNESEIKLFGN